MYLCGKLKLFGKIPALSGVFLKCFRRVSRAFSHILILFDKQKYINISQVCLYMSAISEVYLKHIFMHIAALWHILGISQRISALNQTFKCLFSHEIISLNLISFDISLLFMDTEIFLAATSSSRSDDVTLSVCLLACLLVCLLVTLFF